ncbi:hypothetical protein CLV33_103258 [Jejuia pallidilutea]|uniref:Uncharacterized protein n=1 Tax=Jejuia pallidilutea TaxID=504487 RepID=A0A362X1K5_9FLAO|nr:hypothetical protein [Jejuia pallidilutea]PQV49620.1 hypothetical protein CLV33_103258 [Jejuia pallidilutea]
MKLFLTTPTQVLFKFWEEKKALELLKTAFNTMASQGLVFEKAEVKHVSDVVVENEQYRCYVKGFNQIKMGNLRIKSKSYLFGIYDNNKDIWCFLEAEKLKNKALTEMILPNFKTSLDIPSNEMTTEEI